jgi:hypothetical protein
MGNGKHTNTELGKRKRESVGSDVVSCVEDSKFLLPERIEPCKKQDLNIPLEFSSHTGDHLPEFVVPFVLEH